MKEEKDLENIVKKEEKSFFKRTGRSLLSLVDKTKDFVVEHDTLSFIIAGATFFSLTYFGVCTTYLYNDYVDYIRSSRVDETVVSFKDYILNNALQYYNTKEFLILSFGSAILAELFVKTPLTEAKYRRKLGIKEDKGTIYDGYMKEPLIKKIKRYSKLPFGPLIGLSDFLLERPVLPATGVFAYYSVADLITYYLNAPTLVHTKLIPIFGFSTILGFLSYWGVRLISLFLHSTGKTSRKLLLGMTAEKLDKKDYALKVYTSDSSSPTLRFFKAKLLMEQGNLEDSLGEYELALSQINTNPEQPDFPFFMPKDFFFSVVNLTKQIEKNRKSIIPYMSLTTILFELNYPEKSLEIFEQMLQNNPELPELFCYAASFCEMINRHEDAQSYLRRGIDVFLSKPDAESRFREIPGSRNEVLYINSRYLGKEFIFKRSPEEEGIRRESTVTSLTNDVLNEYLLQYNLGRDFVTVEQSISFLEHLGLFYHNKKRNPGKRLEEKYAKITRENAASLMQDINASLASLAKLHGLVSPHVLSENKTYYVTHRTRQEQKEIIPVFDFSEEIKRRFISRLGHHESEKELLDRINEFVNSELRGIANNYLIHGDFYDTNVLEGGVLIDLERASIANPFVDLASFFGNPKYKELDKLDKAELLGFYLSQLNSFSKAPLGAAEIKLYPHVELLVNMCQIGSKLNQQNLSAASQYLHQVKKSLTGFISLHKAFNNYIRNAPNAEILTNPSH